MPIGERNRRHFPGLIPEEAFLWRLWLADHEGEFLSFAYNVHVGQGADPGAGPQTGDPALDARLLEQWRKATQRRIDVVGYAVDETVLFEVEVEPGARALGQLLAYETLFPLAFPEARQITLAAVCRRLSRDMRDVYESQAIRVYVLGPAAE